MHPGGETNDTAVKLSILAMAMAMFSALSAVILCHSANGISLDNGLLQAKLTATAELVQLGSVASTPHVFANDSWRVVLSAFNSTDDIATLEPSSCLIPKQSALTAESATFKYSCDDDKWEVDVTYSLPKGAQFLSKGLRIGLPGGKPWAGTVRSIETWRALGLVGGQTVYDGFAASLPYKTDFHPTNASNKHPTHSGFGVSAEWLGGFYRRGSHMDGLFVTVSNPFGVYSAPNTTTKSNHDLRAEIIPGFEYHANETCGNDKYQFIHNQTAEQCAAACAAQKQCLQVSIREHVR